MLLRRLPVDQPEQLVLFTQPGSHYGNNGSHASSFPMYEDFREAFVDHAVAPPLPRVSLPYDVASSGPLFSGVFCRFASSMNLGSTATPSGCPAKSCTAPIFRAWRRRGGWPDHCAAG